MASTKHLKLRNFDMTKINPETGVLQILGYFILIMGKRGSGKTSVALSFLHTLQHHVDYAIAISATSDMSKALDGIIPASFIYNTGDTELLTRIMEVQKKVNKKMVLFIDDMAFDKKFLASDEFKEIIFNGRWLNITVILTTQYSKAMPPTIRSNVDLCITMRQNNVIVKKALYEEFFAIVTTQDFDKILNQATKQFSALVFDNRVQAETLNEVFFWFRADLDQIQPQHLSKLVRPAFWGLDAQARIQQRKPTSDRCDPVVIGHHVGAISIADVDGKTLVGQTPTPEPAPTSRKRTPRTTLQAVEEEEPMSLSQMWASL